jgi:hypothetical protein
MAWPSSIRTWLAGEKLTAALLNEQLRDPLNEFDDAWTAYTPTLTGSTTNPTNFTIVGQWVQAGKMIDFRVLVTFTAGATAGSGVYNISLPIAPNWSAFEAVGTCTAVDSSTSTRYGMAAVFSGGTNLSAVNSSGSRLSATFPVAWASGDTIAISGSYESI